jgi:hypothetical protein
MTVALTALELLVAFLQADVFAILRASISTMPFIRARASRVSGLAIEQSRAL